MHEQQTVSEAALARAAKLCQDSARAAAALQQQVNATQKAAASVQHELQAKLHEAEALAARQAARADGEQAAKEACLHGLARRVQSDTRAADASALQIRDLSAQVAGLGAQVTASEQARDASEGALQQMTATLGPLQAAVGRYRSELAYVQQTAAALQAAEQQLMQQLATERAAAAQISPQLVASQEAQRQMAAQMASMQAELQTLRQDAQPPVQQQLGIQLQAARQAAEHKAMLSAEALAVTAEQNQSGAGQHHAQHGRSNDIGTQQQDVSLPPAAAAAQPDAGLATARPASPIRCAATRRAPLNACLLPSMLHEELVHQAS